MALQFKKIKHCREAVILDGKVVGHINWMFKKGFYYRPKNSKIIGEAFLTIEDCRDSLREN